VSTPRKGAALEGPDRTRLARLGFRPLHTVTETVKLFAGFFSHPRSVAETLELVGLSRQSVHAYRTTLRRTAPSGRRGPRIIGSPELLFLDEPTTGFDPSARESSDDARGTAFGGDLDSVDDALHGRSPALCDRIAILAAGRIVARARRRHSSRWPVRRRCDSASSTDSTSGPCRERPALSSTCKGKSPRRRWPTRKPSCFDCCSTSSARASSWSISRSFDRRSTDVFLDVTGDPE